jgi:predicted RND superfamily exporter protein/CRP-like cAMP-binding protein
LVLLVLLVVTSFLGFHARRLQLDFSVENLLASDDPNKAYYDEIRTLFGSDDLAVIGLLTDNVYTPATLEKIGRITAQVEKIDGVSSVNSLTNTPDPIANVDDPPLLIPQIPTNPETLAAIRSKVEDNPIYLNLVSRDAKGAAILIFFKPLTDAEFANKKIEERLEEILARERGSDELYLAGTQNLKLNSVKLMREDLRTFTPLSVLVIMGVLGVCFRTFRGVFLPLLSVLCGVIWTLGIMALSEAPITIGTLVLPSLLIVIGSTYSIYVIAQYEEEVEKGGSPTEVVERALARVSLPVIVAAFTTIVGFITLLVNRISTIRALGLYAAVGFTCITIIVLTLIPAVLVRLPLPRRKTRHGERQLTALLRRVGQFNHDYQKAIILGAGLLVLPCLWGITYIRADSNLLQFFHKDAPVRRANEIISEKIGGTQPFNIVVNSGMKEGAKSWDLLRRIKGLQRYLATLPGIDHTLSLVDYCELFDKAIQSGVPMEGVESAEISVPPAEPQTGTGVLLASLWEDQAQMEAPAQLRPVMQLITLLPKTYSSMVVSPDFSTANILVRTRLTSSSDIIRTAEAVRTYAKEHFPPEVTVRPTGNLILLNEATEDIVWGQVESLGLALLVIFVVLSLMFLSVKVGVLSLIPNLLAILIFFGAMGWTGVSLNLGTSIIASIAIGIAVEDAIRYLARLSAEIRETHDQERAIFQTITTVGKPIIYASAALGLGFLTLLFSNFVPIQKFGLLTTITIAAAFVNDLVLLPALLATTRIITLWDLLYLKLGKDPHKTIGLFSGLRPSQAKIVTLMGELKTFPYGQAIIRKGDVGDEMYVMINGTADVFLISDTQRRRVRQMKRGDVFGEMGLIGRHERTADVIAAEDVEVMAVNERFLDRLQSRYPRIGAKIFLNLARIISARLQEAQRT